MSFPALRGGIRVLCELFVNLFLGDHDDCLCDCRATATECREEVFEMLMTLHTRSIQIQNEKCHI
jgi:hypothetical protein